MDIDKQAMSVLVTGSSGFIAAHLLPFLEKEGFQITPLLRRGSKRASQFLSKEIFWDIEKRQLDSSQLEGFDIVIHLAGENIASARWNAEKKRQILDSRVNSTTLLAEALGRLQKPPKLFISSSAIGFYGDQGDRICSESTPSGQGFLAEVCRQWEAAAAPIAQRGIRTVIMRHGIVLSLHGGVLKKMTIPFSLGLGGKLGPGTQFMSWVAMQDLLEIYLFAMRQAKVQGPLNVVSPNPVTNQVFTRALGKVLKRPTPFPMPSFLLRALLGKEMARELLLSSVRAIPARLLEYGYRFRYPDLDQTLKSIYA